MTNRRVASLPSVRILVAALGAAALLLSPGLSREAPAQVPTPESVIGWEPGADYRLADYSQIREYFRRVAEASDRVELEQIGTSVEGRAMWMAKISTPENLANQERYREIARRLAMARDLTDEEARELASEGKAVVWIDAGLHATEVATASVSLFSCSLAALLGVNEQAREIKMTLPEDRYENEMYFNHIVKKQLKP